MTIEPSGNILVVEKIDKSEIKKSVIAMPDDVTERFWLMKVVAYGKSVRDIVKMDINVGDTVITSPMPAVDNEVIDPENPQLKLMSAQNILGRIL